MAVNPCSKETKFKLYSRQILTAFGPLLTATVCGMISGYSAVLLPQIKAPVHSFTGNNSFVNDTTQHEIRITTIDEESWIASAAVLPMAPGSWMAGILMEKLGRKKSTMAILPLSVVGWLTIALATDFTCIIAGRLISGIYVGLVAPLNPVYISETSDPHLRGVLLSGVSLALCLGILLVHLIGTWSHWRTTTYICTVVPCISFIMSVFAQESPTWLLNKGRKEDAKRAWIYFRGEESLDEYLLLEATKVAGTTAQHKISLKEILTTRYFLLPLTIMCVFFFTSQFCGTNVTVFYSVDLLADVTGPENAYLGSLIVDAVRLVFSCVASILINKYARRSLTFISGFGTAFTLLLLSLCLYYDFGKPWLSAVLLMVDTAFLTLGLVPLAWTLCGELFPSKYRGVGTGFTSGFTFICFFIVVKLAPAMIAVMKLHGTFATYGVLTLVTTSILYFILPETKDKTLQEIELCFDKKPKKPVQSSNVVNVNEPA